MSKSILPLTIILILSLLLGACATVAPAESGGAEDVAEPAAEAGGNITFWSTETEPERVERTTAILDAFTEQSGIEVELVPVEEDQLPELLTASAAANSLPDALFFPLDFAIGWAEQGILDYEIAKEIVDELGAETFSQGALEMVGYEGGYAGIPSDGWGQLLIFRQDLFDAAGLETPDTYEKILSAAEALHDPDISFFGITAANDVAVFTQQTFEHIALANGCQLVDDTGAVTLDTPECVGAINMYNDIQTKYGPVGQQDVVSTRATYFAGQAGMIIWSPFILDEMCGLRDAALPTCPECGDEIDFLAKNSGFVPAYVGPDGDAPAQYGQFSNIGISTTADKAAVTEFLNFWFNDGYVDWLAVAPEGKLPMRTGTPDEPNKFIDAWKALETGVDRRAPLGDCYGDEVINTILEGATSFDRWGFKEGQGALVQAVYQSLPVPQALNDTINGAMTPDEAAAEMQAAVEELQQ